MAVKQPITIKPRPDGTYEAVDDDGVCRGEGRWFPSSRPGYITLQPVVLNSDVPGEPGAYVPVIRIPIDWLALLA